VKAASTTKAQKITRFNYGEMLMSENKVKVLLHDYDITFSKMTGGDRENMLVKFTRHAKRKLKILGKLGVTKEKVIETLKNPEELLYDTLRDRLIAINYTSNIAIPFEKEDEDLTVVTILYSSELESIVRRRKRSGRWI